MNYTRIHGNVRLIRDAAQVSQIINIGVPIIRCKVEHKLEQKGGGTTERN